MAQKELLSVVKVYLKWHDGRVTTLVLTTQNLHCRIAVKSERRNDSVETTQQKNRETQQYQERPTQHQRSGTSPTAPWRFVRDPAKLLLRFLCSHCALYTLVAIKALPLRLCNWWTALQQCFRCVLTLYLCCFFIALTLRSWVLNCAHDDCLCTLVDHGIKTPHFHGNRH